MNRSPSGAGRGRRILLCLFACVVPLSGCSLLTFRADAFSGLFDRTENLLVLVEDGLYALTSASIARYRADLAAAGVASSLELWPGGTASDLRSFLAAHHRAHGTDGAFLVGSLPAAWYEMQSAERYEQFPTDVFLMAPDSQWLDTDRDFLYDAHSPLTLSFYVSRLNGTPAEVEAYFAKLHRYYSGEGRVPPAAFIFKDDDWSDFQRGSSFGLSFIYDSIDYRENPEATLRSGYVDRVGGTPIEFVYQWIHSYPSALCVEEAGRYAAITTQDIAAMNAKGLFYNLYDCSAARFTERNLGMSYLIGTEYALAVFGSTKVGGCYHPLAFNQTLSLQGSWGDAYRNWYNYDGKNDDGWFLGMVILGDPALKVSQRAAYYRFADMSLAPAPDERTVTDLEKIFTDFSAGDQANGFEEYRQLHPEFF